MNWLLRARARYRLVKAMGDLVHWQAILIEVKDTQIEQMKIAVLANQQAYRDLAIAWRILVESPEVDVRDDLDTLIRDLSDQVAVLEEQVVA